MKQFTLILILSSIAIFYCLGQGVPNYNTHTASGAKLRVTYVDNEATITVTGPGSYRRDYSIPYKDNNPYRTDYLSIIPVLSTFAYVYTVTIVVKNERNDNNWNPMGMQASLYSVGDDNAAWDKPGQLIKDGVVSFQTPGKGYSGKSATFTFTVQKF